MNIKNYGLSLAFVAVVAGPFAVSGCNQVGTQCIVGPSESAGYAALYKLKSQTGTCPALPKGDTIGMEDFHPLNGEASRDLTKNTVYIQTQEMFNYAGNVSSCYDAPDPTTGYKGGDFDDKDPKDAVWSVGSFRDYLPDANNFCYIDKTSPAKIVVPEIPATTATTNPAPACFSPSANCDNPDGTFSTACICDATAKPPLVDNCCDKFYQRCADGTECTKDVDCCDPTDAGCIAKPKKGSCETPTSSVCSNDKTITTCTSDADCCPADPNTGAPDPKCTNGVHTCFQAGPVVSSCHTSAIPTDFKSYTWSNMKFVNTSAVPGTQFTATVTYSDTTCQSQIYDVVALWPSVSCILTGPDGGTPVDKNGMPTNTPIPDDLACCPTPEVLQGHPSGSGINPNFPVHCDHDLLICVLDSDTLPADNGRGYPTGCPKPQAAAGSEN